MGGRGGGDYFRFLAQSCRCGQRFHGSGDVGSFFSRKVILFCNAAAVTCCSGHQVGFLDVLKYYSSLVLP